MRPRSRFGTASFVIPALLATSAPVAAAAATKLLWPWLQSVSLFFFPAIILAAVGGGPAAGGAAAVFSTLLAHYGFESPGATLGVDDGVRLATFLGTALACASFVMARKRVETQQRNAIDDLSLALDHRAELSDELERRVAERTSALEAANEALKAEIVERARLAERLVKVQETERRDLARELHDQVGQTLTALKFTIEALSRRRGSARAEATAGSLELVESLMSQIRELSLDLRPSILDDLGLVPALLWHLDRYTTQTGITVTFSHAGLDERLAGELETAAFRIVQEGLTNVARHAGVRDAALWVRQDRGELCVIIEDAGRGFDADALPAGKSSGITGMRERATLLGGSFSLQSSRGTGTQITAVWPVRAVAQETT